MSRVRLTLLVHEDWRDRYPLVLERCRQAGLEVERELAATGAIAGSIAEEHLAALTAVEGIAAVERERTNTTSPQSPECAADDGMKPEDPGPAGA